MQNTLRQVLCIAGLLLAAGFVVPTAAQGTLWFDQLIDIEPLPHEVERQVAHQLVAALRDPSTRDEAPASSKADRTPRMLFASLSDGTGPAQVLLGAGNGATAAIRQILDQVGE
ncbi:MAG: hypothetical protein AAF657_04370, partial [Acidobacteriota bacterium]